MYHEVLKLDDRTLFMIILVVALMIQSCLAWTIPFSASTPFDEKKELEDWLASRATITRRNFDARPASDYSTKERILILTPLKDASSHLPYHFSHLANLTYPHHLIDLGFIIGDSTDDTQSILDSELDKLNRSKSIPAFNGCSIVHKDIGDVHSQDVAIRHGFEGQVDRRKKLAIVRNTLLQKALTKEHDWVYWRDVDIAESPDTILEDLIAHDKDVLTPSKRHTGALT